MGHNMSSSFIGMLIEMRALFLELEAYEVVAALDKLIKEEGTK